LHDKLSMSNLVDSVVNHNRVTRGFLWSHNPSSSGFAHYYGFGYFKNFKEPTVFTTVLTKKHKHVGCPFNFLTLRMNDVSLSASSTGSLIF
jgi:hypothetical protein